MRCSTKVNLSQSQGWRYNYRQMKSIHNSTLQNIIRLRWKSVHMIRIDHNIHPLKNIDLESMKLESLLVGGAGRLLLFTNVRLDNYALSVASFIGLLLFCAKMKVNVEMK